MVGFVARIGQRKAICAALAMLILSMLLFQRLLTADTPTTAFYIPLVLYALCLAPLLPAVGSDGITRMVRACVEGPVFRGDLVRWDDVGTIPFDALGAPGWKPRPGAGQGGRFQLCAGTGARARWSWARERMSSLRNTLFRW